MSVNYMVSTTKLNRLKVSLANTAVTPAAGTSVDGRNANGFIVIGNTNPISATVLAVIPLQLPSFTFAGNTATLAGTPLSANATANGTAGFAELWDSANTIIIGGLTVGTSATDVIINTTTITSGETITCTSGTITG